MWAKYLYSHGHNAASSIWINLDETALPLHATGRHGNVHRNPAGTRQGLSCRGSLHERRAHCTLVATTCTCPILQKKLPQILLPNTLGKKKVWKAILPELLGEPPIEVIGDTQGWINAAKMVTIVDLLWKVCREHSPGKRIVLVWDCSPAHICPEVVTRMRKRDMRPLFIPSKLTHLLQVLDFAVFASFKKKYHEQQVAQLMMTATGQQPFDEWIRSTVACIRSTFGDCDVAAQFRRAGQCTAGGPYRPAITNVIGEHYRPGGRIITKEEFWFLVGRKQQFVYEKLFSRMPPMDVVGGAALPEPARRLRSRTTL